MTPMTEQEYQDILDSATYCDLADWRSAVGRNDTYLGFVDWLRERDGWLRWGDLP